MIEIGQVHEKNMYLSPQKHVYVNIIFLIF